jgi:hypothetical protein
LAEAAPLQGRLHQKHNERRRHDIGQCDNSFWLRQSKKAQARQLLAELYVWFPEGFDTVDLQETKALLEALTKHD